MHFDEDDTMIITEEMKRYYMEHKGKRCPHCKSDDIESWSNFQFSDMSIKITNKIHCNTCRLEWNDVYTLTDIIGADEEIPDEN